MEFSQKPSVVDWLLAHAVRVEYAENGLFFLFYYSLCSYYAYYKAKFILNFAKLVASDKYIPANSHACGLKTSISRPLMPADQFLTPD